MNKNLSYKPTIGACFIGYVVQAISINYLPLLFITLENQYGISLTRITFLITLNFGLQLLTDIAAAFFIDKIGYRAASVMAHLFTAIGFIALAFLPDLLPSPYVGLLIAVCLYAVGGGLLEVVISPMVEACPSSNKKREMSLLHSFYCWGCVGVVIISTAFFAIFGIENWKILALIWAIVPIANAIVFTIVPVVSLKKENGNRGKILSLLKQKNFWLMIILMFCAGACESSVYQWSSTFAEQGLNVPKSVGDLAGPMTFALAMGITRVLYAKFSAKLSLKWTMIISGGLCLTSYLLIGLSTKPVFGFIGLALCGVSVAILWPGTYSTAAEIIKGANTAMFAFLALAGDVGCTVGPTLVGLVSGALGDNLRYGVLVAAILPIVLIATLFFVKIPRYDSEQEVKLPE